MYLFPDLEPVYCSMSGSNCCFLTCIQVSQEAGQVVWYSHLFQNFPQFVVIHAVRGFGVVSKAEVGVGNSMKGEVVTVFKLPFFSFCLKYGWFISLC